MLVEISNGRPQVFPVFSNYFFAVRWLLLRLTHLSFALLAVSARARRVYIAVFAASNREHHTGREATPVRFFSRDPVCGVYIVPSAPVVTGLLASLVAMDRPIHANTNKVSPVTHAPKLNIPEK